MIYSITNIWFFAVILCECIGYDKWEACCSFGIDLTYEI
jgi:hypothetical protein